ncbi:hypothetical protein RJ639_025627, partial [Escallonia herrerae]
ICVECMQVGAEFVGTFILVFAAAAGPIVNQKYDGVETLIGNAACSGLAVMIVILSTGHISGAHLNPSVTIAFAALRHFPWNQVPAYIAAQVSASVCASFALKGIFHPFMSGGVTVPSIGTGQAFALEFLVTFNLMFVITAVATDTRAVGELAGIAIGATVLLDILIAGSYIVEFHGRRFRDSQAINWGFNESCENAGSSTGHQKLREDMGIHGLTHAWGPGWGGYLHIREAQSGRG